MGTAKANKTAWTDKNVKSGAQYKYTVRACYNKIKSSYKDSNTTVFLTQPTVKFANASNGIKVSWSKVNGATGYTVYRSQLTDGKWSSWKNMGTAKSNKSSWVDKKVTSGVQYKYTVRACYNSIKSSYANTKGLLYLAQPAVTVKAVSNGINVSWTQCEGATGYTVYSSEYNAKTKKWSSWKSRGTAKATAKSWTDKKAKSGVTYRYTVRAVNADTGAKSTYVASKNVKR
jgi:fibronectin type 3 domain-containing protein